ncbi:MAG: hypothetical protein HYY87_02445 [Candidatus Levybacteria bacterium]|nr:hypothetical protein [Candidatus Levybacteria bacterium]
MDFSAKHFPLKIIIFLIILSFAGVLFLANYEKLASLNPPNPALIKPIAPTPEIQNTEVHSPDGEMNLIMQAQKQSDGSATYSFIASDIAGKNNKILFEKTVGFGVSMEISYNSWSPDNKYVFLRENKVDSFDIFIFKASAENFSNGEKYIDVMPRFAESKIKYVIKDITGWDSPTLLHVVTSGPSYWFDITTRAFLQLVRR